MCHTFLTSPIPSVSSKTRYWPRYLGCSLTQIQIPFVLLSIVAPRAKPAKGVDHVIAKLQMGPPFSGFFFFIFVISSLTEQFLAILNKTWVNIYSRFAQQALVATHQSPTQASSVTYSDLISYLLRHRPSLTQTSSVTYSGLISCLLRPQNPSR